jgi:hypothetical protein
VILDKATIVVGVAWILLAVAYLILGLTGP